MIFPDYRAHRAGLGFAHRLDQYVPNTTGRLNFAYNRFTYPETDTETEVYLGTVGLAYELTEKWRLLLDIGPDYYDSQFNVFGTQFKDSGWGGTGTLKIAYTGEVTGSSLTLFHGIEPASGRDGSAQRTSAIFDIFYRFAERGRTGFATGYYVNKANSGELALLPLDERTFRLQALAALRHHLRQTLPGGLLYVFICQGQDPRPEHRPQPGLAPAGARLADTGIINFL